MASAPPAHEFLRLYLADRDEPCPSCGYSLRALTGNRCPECGQEVALRLALAEPRLALFIAGLVPLCGGLGFAGILLAWILIEGQDRDRAKDGVTATLAGGLVIFLFALAIWIRGRRWISRGPLAARLLLVLFAWAALVSYPVVMALVCG